MRLVILTTNRYLLLLLHSDFRPRGEKGHTNAQFAKPTVTNQLRLCVGQSLSVPQANRTTATEFIQEMLDARLMLRSDPKLTIYDLIQALILRREYFEEVPETANFLRENDPESLFSDRARPPASAQR